MDKIWQQSYPASVPVEIDPNGCSNLVELCEQAMRQYAAQDAYCSMGKRVSFAALDQLSQDFAAWLQYLGLQRGERVALMMPNILQYPIALFGTLRAGCTIVNCNPLYTATELEHQLQDSGAGTIVIVENFAHVLQKVLPNTAVKRVVVTSMGEMLGALKGTVVNFVVRKVKKLVPLWHIPQAISLQTALWLGRRHGRKAITVTGEDVAFLQYTGGTTGVSKGAILTHRNVASNVQQAHAWMRSAVRDGQETILTALPLYHIFALTANCLTFLMVGARNVLVANARDLPSLIREWDKYQITAVTGVNTLFNGLLNHPDFAKLNFSTLRITLGGGMAVQAPVAERWKKVTGCTLSQAYGLTETSPAATINPLDLPDFNGSIGLPISSTEVSIRDDFGLEVPLGSIGEICIRGPQVMRGYWQRPDETAKVTTDDGFLRTGDMGYINPKGFVYLVDRKKDMIIVSGFKVYPNEVEEAVAKHPGVVDVAAIGVASEHSGESVKIFVVRKDPQLTEAALLAHCREHLTGYKVPKLVEFRPDLPRTNVGKILRRALKESV